MLKRAIEMGGKVRRWEQTAGANCKLSTSLFTYENTPHRTRFIEAATQQITILLDDLKADFLEVRGQLRGRIKEFLADHFLVA